MDWNYITQFHLKPPTIHLPRTKAMQEKYDEVMSKNKDRADDLRKKLFPNNEKWTLSDNIFPYDFRDKTKHMVAWFSEDYVDYSVIQEALSDFDIVFYENFKNNRSIHSIRHVHVFIKS